MTFAALSYRRVPAVLVLIAAGLIAPGCGGDPAAPAEPVAVAISPGSATVNGGASETFTATVTNAANTAVTWTATGGTVVPTGNSANYTAPFVGGSFTLTATSVQDPTKNKAITITVPSATVSVTPGPVTIGAGGAQNFTATVANTTNTAVTWAASAGTLVATGNSAAYTAPNTGGNYTVTATSVADPSRSGGAAVTVTPVAVALSPAAISLYREEPADFTVVVTGTANTSVTWNATCGAVVGTGATITYTPPATAGECRVIAVSALDLLTADTVVVTVRSDWLISTLDDVDDGACNFAHCSLREAIAAANATPGAEIIRIGVPAAGLTAGLSGGGAAFGGSTLFGASNIPGGSTLRGSPVFPVNSTPPSITGVGTITLTSALPEITSNVEIVGAGTTQTIIDANATQATPRRVFSFNGALTASVRGLTVQGGVTFTAGGGVLLGGGANVTLTDVRITDNEVHSGVSGGIHLAGASTAVLNNVDIVANRALAAAQAAGGFSAVESSTLTMAGGSISNNTVANGPGGGGRILASNASFTDVEVMNNSVTAGSGNGGGISVGSGSMVTFTQVTVTGNTTPGEGGGIRADGATFTMTESTVSGNSANPGAGLSIGNPVGSSITETIFADNISAGRAGGINVFGTGSLSLSDVVISGNRANDGDGGGIIIQGVLAATMTDVDVTGNKAIGTGRHGGGIYVGSGATLQMDGGSILNNETTTGWGGGLVMFAGTVVLDDVVIADNKVFTATGFGGGIAALGPGSNLTVSGGEIARNTTAAAGGGIILTAAQAHLENVDIHHNTAVFNGGGAQFIADNAVTMNTVQFRNNTTASNGGGFSLAGNSTLTGTNVTLTANQSTVAGGAMLVNASTLTLTGATATGNSAGTNGGVMNTLGAANINISNSTFSTNTASGQGGALQLGGSGTILLNRVSVVGNAAPNGGGGITSGVVGITITNSTISGNSTNTTGGGFFSASTANSVVRNTTFSGNSAGIGGGMGITGASTLTNVTFVGNSATDFGGAVGANNAGNVVVNNVLMSDNLRQGVAQNCGTGGAPGGIITSGGNNLSNDATCVALTMLSDKPNVASGVSATLANNGGPTLTHALLLGSLAIDAGNIANCLTTDQRGFARAGVCDIGAFEFGGAAGAAARASAAARHPFR